MRPGATMKKDAFKTALRVELEEAARSAAKYRFNKADARTHIVGWLLHTAGVDNATFESWLSSNETKDTEGGSR
jgi:hypothetical protein